MPGTIDWTKPFDTLSPEQKEQLVKSLYTSKQDRRAKSAGKREAMKELTALHSAEYQKLLAKHGAGK